MSITHEEARRLIQFKADEALQELDQNLLEAHLGSCFECQTYENSIHELESTLRPLLQRKWNQQHLPLSSSRVFSKRTKNRIQNTLIATRIAAMGLICIAFLFNIWQYTQTGAPGSTPPAADVPLIPTPSLQSTQTRLVNSQCEPITYAVQKDDSLQGIAERFSIPVEEIQSANNLISKTLTPAMQLAIPVCDSTPAGTPNIGRTTFTPYLGSNTLTPVNKSTQ